MSAKTETIIKDLMESIKNVGKEKTSPYDSIATVTRIEDGIAWVHFEGGAKETPARLTINAKVGEQVQVRVSDGVAFLVGNASAPPTDDERAIKAENAANRAADYANIAYRAANQAVEDAQIASDAAAQAQTSAETANEAAEQAISDAATAQSAAEQAQTDANTAKEAAEQATTDAATANTAATQAQADAEVAKTAAATANTTANTALTQLSVVEDVVGTLKWISEHGDYAETSDTEVVPGKLYFTRSEVYGDNLIPYPYYHTTRTHNGIIYTDNGDGTITANGTASADAVFTYVLRGSSFAVNSGEYILTGCPHGGSVRTYRQSINRLVNGSGVDFGSDTGSGYRLALSEETAIGIYIVIKSGTTVTNLTFNPSLQQISYTYSLVTDPESDPSAAGYYELTGIDEAVSNYVASHLALTDAGLWVVTDDAGYKILVSSDSVKIYDEMGKLVSTFGESIFFDSSRPQRIGGDTAYVEWYDTDADGTADSLRIVGANITIEPGDSIDSAIQNAKSEVSEEIDSVNTTLNESIDGITEQYNALKEEVDANDEKASEEIVSAQNELQEAISSAIEQLETAQSLIDTLSTKTESFSFSSEYGFVLYGQDATDSEGFKLQLAAQAINFINGALTNSADILAYITGNDLNITNAVIRKQLRLGNFAFIPRTNGNMSLKYLE